MSAKYRAVSWNRQKRRYDLWMFLLILLYLGVFVSVTLIRRPQITPETLVLRATGSLAFVMLHVVLIIGPLSRLSRRLLPLLYNRRHLGVTLCLIALVHGIVAIFQFHTLGDVHPLISVFTANTHYDSMTRFPFQPLGFIALLVLILMAATSHDFWLRNLGPAFWKSMHMLVYVAYGLLVGHVALGILQYESFAPGFALLGSGVTVVIALHIVAAFRERTSRKYLDASKTQDHMYYACDVSDIEEGRARIVCVQEEEIALFKYDRKLSAVHNLCKHQNGPLGEGMIVDGCITCPWHGYQYLPDSGASPPPFTEKVNTYRVSVRDGKVYVDPRPCGEGVYVKPALID